MVHALHEAWRILVPQGILIDLRPLCDEAPLEIVFTEGSESAGYVDMSPNIADEIAADHAIDSVVREGIFMELKAEYFDIAMYWNTVKDMKADMDERWKDDVILREQVLRRAGTLFKKQREKAPRVRLRHRERLVTFEKR